MSNNSLMYKNRCRSCPDTMLGLFYFRRRNNVFNNSREASDVIQKRSQLAATNNYITKTFDNTEKRGSGGNSYAAYLKMKTGKRIYKNSCEDRARSCWTTGDEVI